LKHKSNRISFSHLLLIVIEAVGIYLEEMNNKSNLKMVKLIMRQGRRLESYRVKINFLSEE